MRVSMNRAAGLYRAPQLEKEMVCHVSGYMPPDPHPMRSDWELAEDLPVQASVTPLEIRNMMCNLACRHALSVNGDIHNFAATTTACIGSRNDLFTSMKNGWHVMRHLSNASLEGLPFGITLQFT